MLAVVELQCVTKFGVANPFRDVCGQLGAPLIGAWRRPQVCGLQRAVSDASLETIPNPAPRTTLSMRSASNLMSRLVIAASSVRSSFQDNAHVAKSWTNRDVCGDTVEAPNGVRRHTAGRPMPSGCDDRRPNTASLRKVFISKQDHRDCRNQLRFLHDPEVTISLFENVQYVAHRRC
jgi:hypothetical protein